MSVKPGNRFFFRQMTIRYTLVFVVLALIAIANYLLHRQQVESHQFSAAAINLSGRQRLLLQQTYTLSYSLITMTGTKDRADLRKDLIDTIRLMEDSHEALVHGNPNMHLSGIKSEKIQALYFNSIPPLDTQVRNYIAEVQLLAHVSNEQLSLDNAHFEYVHTTQDEGRLLEALNAVVEQFQLESERHSRQMRIVEIVIFLMTLWVLALAAGFVIRPMAKRIREEMEKLSEADASIVEMNMALSHAMPGISKLSADGYYLEVNEVYASMLEYAPNELIGKTCTLTTHPEDRAAILEAKEEMMRKGKAELEVRALCKDGSHFYKQVLLVTTNEASRHKSGVMETTTSKSTSRSGFYCFMRDISERKQFEMELHDHKEHLEELIEQRTAELSSSQARFAGILDIAEDAIISTDDDHCIVLFNQGAEKIFGYTVDDILGQPLNTLLPERYQETHNHHMHNFSKGFHHARKMGDRREIYGLRKDGSEFPAEASISRLELSNETIYTVMLRDITGRKQVEQELVVAKDQAESANQAKTQFLANMSHEIRTPLNSIVGFSQILLNRGRALDLPMVFGEYLENIKISGQNLSELINNILDLSKIEAGKMALSEEHLNVKMLVESIYHINKVQALQKGVVFSYDFDPRLPMLIHSDRTKLNQILMNLTVNAIKFTPAGKSVKLLTDRHGDSIRFRIVDEGIGIPKDRQESIFESFEQVDGTITRNFDGTGLGLAITHKNVKLLRGHIEVESAPDEGSTFTVTIPLVEAVYEGLAEVTTDLQNLRFVPNNVVLLIEDNPTNQEMMKALFNDLNLVLEVAGDGEDGIQKTVTLHPDLVLMDMHMPGMDGLTTTKHIRLHDECESIPIIALSANAFTEQQQAAYEAGVDGYLTKPVDFNKLLPILLKHLRQESVSGMEEQEGLSPLPPEDQKRLLHEFQVLSEIPIFLSQEIIQQVNQMKLLCQGYTSPYLDTLRSIEHAVFSRNSKQIPDLIRHAFELDPHSPETEEHHGYDSDC